MNLARRIMLDLPLDGPLEDPRKRCEVEVIGEDKDASSYPVWVLRHSCGRVVRYNKLRSPEGEWRAPQKRVVCRNRCWMLKDGTTVV
jgi:hypothetical protein